MKKIRTILIDADKSEIKEVHLNTKDIMNILNCDKNSVFRTNFTTTDNSIIYNLYTQYKKNIDDKSFIIQNWKAPIRGNAIICGNTFSFKMKDTELTIEEIKSLIKFL